MKYDVVEIDHSYNEELLGLAKLMNTGSDLFYVDRSPNFFMLSEEFGETKQYGLFKSGQLIGNIAVSKQMRIVSEEKMDVYYLNDLRIHPDFQRTRAYYRLIEYLFKTYKANENTNWMFSTILDSNMHKAEIIKGCKAIPGGTKIGTTVHIGIPMFCKLPNRKKTVIEISGEEAWGFYQLYTKKLEFAPYDKNLFLRKNGLFLAIKTDNQVEAVCKLIDQSMSRSLCLSKKLPYYSKFVDVLCNVKGCPLLPSIGGIFRHGYLSYYITKEDGADYRNEFLSYIQEYYNKEFTYVFTGMSKEDAAGRKKSIFHQAISSSTYAFGEIPSGLSLQFHELTLI